MGEAMEQVNQDDHDAVKAFGIQQGIKLSRELLQFGVQGLHYYTLNLEKVVKGIIEGIQSDLKGEVNGRFSPSLISEGSQISVNHKTNLNSIPLNEEKSKISTKIE